VSLAQNLDIDSILKGFDDAWIKTLKRLCLHKVSDPHSHAEVDFNLDFNNEVDESATNLKQNQSFMAFNFDKAKEDYVVNQKYIESSNDLQNLVRAFKTRIEELNENIDEDFMLNITEKVIPDHELKINEFFTQSEDYLKNLNKREEQKAYYLENYVYKRHY
jgi:hypothetical protein